MKFYLSTLLLAILLAALGLEWYLKSTELERNSVLGEWKQNGKNYYRGYYAYLSINDDGTFVKVEGDQWFYTEYQGRYTLERFGKIRFDLQQRLFGDITRKIQTTITCRGGIDSAEILKLEVVEVNNIGDNFDYAEYWNNSFKKVDE